MFHETEHNVFILENGKIAYAVYLNEAGNLENVWFGKALSDYSGILNARNVESGGECMYYDVARGEERRYAVGFNAQCTPLELSSHGYADKRGAPVVIRRKNGSLATDFRCVGRKAYAGIPALSELPHARGNEENCETAEFLFKEQNSEVYLTYRLTMYSDKNVLVKSFEIENREEEPIMLVRAMSMQQDLTSRDYKLVHFHGRWMHEREYAENDILDGIQEISSNFGRSSAEENPFVYLKRSDATADHGVAIGFNLIYSGNFKFHVFSDKFCGTHITYGINEEDFAWTLRRGERFQTPQAIVVYSNEGTDAMSRTFHRFIRENLIGYRGNDAYKPVLFNSWEGCSFRFDTASILAYIDSACKIGTELFVLDDGWFGKRNDDTAGLGDWTVNQDKVDLHKVIAYCHEKGLKFGIWFEPEMVNPDSDLFRTHPDYALGYRKDGKPYLWRHQLHLDFSREEVVDHIYRQMKAFLSEYSVDYIKWDCNRIVMEHEVNEPERQGEMYHRLMLGYYSLLGRLTEEYPHIMFEGCAGGGGRFDLGTLYYCPQIWASDESDPAQRMEIQFNTSLGYPLSCIASHVNDSSVASYTTKAALALFGTYGYEMNPNELTEEEIAELSEIAALYRKYHSEVIEQGDLYHILSPNEGNRMCMQCVSRDKSVSLVLLMNRKKEWQQFRYLRLKGLDGKRAYKNSYDKNVYSGEYYMEVGLNLFAETPSEFDSKLILLTEEK